MFSGKGSAMPEDACLLECPVCATGRCGGMAKAAAQAPQWMKVVNPLT
jgi:hypothetical protein